MSRVDILADAIVNALDVDVSATYHAEDLLQVFGPDFIAEVLTGRHVYVMTSDLDAGDNAARNKGRNQYTYNIVGIERYTGDGLPTTEWQRELKSWFETNVVNVVSELSFTDLLAAASSTDMPMTWPLSARWVEIIDKGQLARNKLFWTELVLTLERVE